MIKGVIKIPQSYFPAGEREFEITIPIKIKSSYALPTDIVMHFLKVLERIVKYRPLKWNVVEAKLYRAIGNNDKGIKDLYRFKVHMHYMPEDAELPSDAIIERGVIGKYRYVVRATPSQDTGSTFLTFDYYCM